MFRRRTIKPNNKRTKSMLEKCPKIYLIGYWARFGIMEFHFAGKYTESGVPYVWMYYDGNGTCDEWHRVPLTYTTTGRIYAWTTSLTFAEEIADALNDLYDN